MFLQLFLKRNPAFLNVKNIVFKKECRTVNNAGAACAANFLVSFISKHANDPILLSKIVWNVDNQVFSIQFFVINLLFNWLCAFLVHNIKTVQILWINISWKYVSISWIRSEKTIDYTHKNLRIISFAHSANGRGFLT
jgi:hypothetical protein